MRTFSPKASDIQRAWHVVDADGLVLGRMATEVARVLRGKHKPIFAPHVDTGDHVIVVNAAKVVLTSDKGEKKIVYRHSGYPGGLKQRTYGDLLATKPEEAIRRAVRGMLPKGPLGRRMLKKLKVYAGPTHPHDGAAAAAACDRARAGTSPSSQNTPDAKEEHVAQAADPVHRTPQAGGARVSASAPAAGRSR